MDPEIAALRRLSENFDSALNSDFADAVIAAACGREIPIHRCILSARSPFFKNIFSGTEGGVKLELKDLARDFEVSFHALVTVLVFLYSGRVRSLRPDGVCVCVDDECEHVACRPAVDFAVEVLYASFVFEIPELVALYQVVELGKRFFPRCSKVLNKMMDDDDWSELAYIQNKTQEERQLKKRQYMELKDVITKAFHEDKEEFSKCINIQSSFSSTSIGGVGRPNGKLTLKK
ncbi:hypothetical protein RHGRI_013010 [Rhododendron griersonianum]|uniref:BTB domain-containing protein n=1 Tax=Rhododendron griersonianum TaxID=479676 RepID=A0AAV6K3Z7_9ERIC|nr:hypothetical protein RHGRI_013010 [Rhododendron griersonianum]